ncbi:MAG: TrmH family RNA methyltransferase [Candidatus Pacebacteria bacterium]|nr:TrmH family RNA methyltransferase [Candidatus Paceibacterota bacterium]MCF7862430.1 TrmH family RNA methyltransferase [Candidatus Paceibacterota bacterium]
MKNNKTQNDEQENIVIVHNIRSAENIGSIFRTSDARGIKKIYLVGVTPLPVDKFERINPKIAKTSLGAEKSVSWEWKRNILPLLHKLKKEGYQLIAIEQDKNSVNYKKLKLKNKNAFILGTEVEGLPKNVLSACDVIAEIPMHGKKESLNVAVSFGIVVFDTL